MKTSGSIVQVADLWWRGELLIELRQKMVRRVTVMLKLVLLLLLLLLSASVTNAQNVSATSRTLLFVDDHDILYRSGTRRELHSPVRHDANPLLTGTVPKNQVGYCS